MPYSRKAATGLVDLIVTIFQSENISAQVANDSFIDLTKSWWRRSKGLFLLSQLRTNYIDWCDRSISGLENILFVGVVSLIITFISELYLEFSNLLFCLAF